MKKGSPFVVLCSLLWILWIFPILCPSTKAQWEGAEVQRLTYDHFWNWMVGLDIDDSDKLYLFYTEKSVWDSAGHVYRNKLLFMTKENGGEWSQPEAIDTSGKIVYSRSSAVVGVDPKGHVIHILYSSYPKYDDTLYYANSNVPNWEFVKIDSLGPEQYREYFSLGMGFDTLGNVHLIWNVQFDSVGYGDWYRVMYANNCTGEWVNQQVSPPIWVGGMQSGPSYLAVQKNGTAHIVYHGEPYCNLECEAFYVRNDSLNSTNWITDTVPKPSRPLWLYWGGPMEVDVNDRVHLLTSGCVEEDCVWPGLTRTFYYYKQAEDSLWQGPETLPDTTFGSRVRVDQLLIDEEGIPYVSYAFSSGEAYFTDRRQGSWQVPYMLVGWQHEDPESLMVENFYFLALDSGRKGHGAFSALNMSQGFWDNDSLEVYYLSSSNSEIDTEEDHIILSFKLFQNHPNPFNPSTLIPFTVYGSQVIVHSPIHTALKIYNILGQKVRTLVDEPKRAGNYELIWDGRDDSGKEVSSGIYFYQLRANNFIETKKLVLIK